MTPEELNELKTQCLDARAVQRRRLYTTPKLHDLFFELTTACNERCFHCGSRCAPGAVNGLLAEKYKEILDDVKESFGTSDILLCITGGEPLLRPDFFDILEYAHELGFAWGMTTNGTLITPDVARRLADVGMRTVSVSIDGLEETHDRQRGMRGGWRRAMEGVKNLLETGAFEEVQITTVVNHRNIGELDALFDIVMESDADSWRVFGIEPIGRALGHPEYLLTAEDQRRMFDFIYEKREAGMPVSYGCSHFLGFDLERNVRSWFFLCTAGITTASIRANGEICACLDIEQRDELAQGNMLTDTFSDVWRNRFEVFRRPLSDRAKMCQGCRYENWCAGGAHHSFDYDKNEQAICMPRMLEEGFSA